MTRPTLLILGAGGNVGAAVAKRFASADYDVALASRSAIPGLRKEDGALLVRLDLAQPMTVQGAFETVTKHFGRGPSVVVYNACAIKPMGDQLDLSIDDFAEAVNVNVVSVFAAAKAALAHRPSGERLTFVSTGGFTYTRAYLRTVPSERTARLATLGVGHSGAAHLLEAIGPLYAEKHDAHFYFGDERAPSGEGMWKGVTADAHAEYYFSLVSAPVGTPVLQTFVDGRGYVKFEQDFA